MSEVVIRTDNLGKQYRIGGQQNEFRTLRDSLTDAFVSPFRRARQLLRGQAYGAAELDETIWALREVSFEIKQGEVVGIIGPNGAGKTTVLKILSRITEPTEGYAEIHGRVGSLLEVGTGFHPELTGRENVYLNGSILGMKKREIDRKFAEIVDFAEIEKFIDTPVKHYSSGMYVRLAFAVAAHLEPEILLVDEVLAVGDASFQKKCLGKMGDVAKEGRTVMFVSHNMVALQSLCDRAILLNDGKVMEEGQPRRVVSKYLQGSSSVLMEQIWDDIDIAPGNNKVRLRRACIRPLEHEPGELITVETPLQLEFEFWNYLPGTALNFSIHIHTIEGIPVFAVASDASPRPKGIVRGKFRIPSGFLNDGVYSVHVMIVKERSVSVYHHPDALTFEIYDSRRSDNWYGKWPGVVRPQFEFPTENLEL